MRRMLYLMHVPWGHIKQRPHFLAEQLSRYYTVFVYYNISYGNRLVKNEPAGGLKARGLFKLPFERHSLLIQRINHRISRLMLTRAVAESDIVWLTEPEMYAPVSEILPSDKHLVYDCMDDALEFSHRKSDKNRYDKTFALERNLCNRSDLIIITSDHLRDVMVERHRISPERILLVNNAISLEDEHLVADSGDDSALAEVHRETEGLQNRVTYIGTIGDWFDFELIQDSLSRLENISYVLVGVNAVKVPDHDRVVHLGPFEHRTVLRIMQESDLLVMPFKLNDLILSTDPVKLYEYVYFAKPCIAVRYRETLKFEDYIYLYSDKEEYVSLLSRFADGNLPPKKSPEECLRFAEGNTWRERGLSIYERIEAAQRGFSAGKPGVDQS